MFALSEIRSAGYNVAVSAKMIDKIREWGEIYENNGKWLGSDPEKRPVSLELPSGIASETARLVLYKGKSWVSGKGGQDSNSRSEWLQIHYSKLMKRLRYELEISCAVGGMVFKPYVVGDELYVDCIPNDRFIPCAFDLQGSITEAAFLSVVVIGSTYYTRIEHHKWTPDLKYTIKNRVFRSNIANSLGTETSLSKVPQWAKIEPERSFKRVQRPLFSYFRLPLANNIDRNSAMGVSCYARAVNQIRQADEQWERTMWEFQGSELAVMADNNMFRVVRNEAELPRGSRRLYRIFQTMGDKETFHEFAPNIRDMSLFNGLNRIFQRIEFNCGLAYGTISDPQVVEKTAEEVRSGKQRSLTHISNIQSALEDSLKHLVYIMDVYADLFGLAGGGEYEMGFEWGDGVTEDRDKEFARRYQLAMAGKYKWEKLFAWYFGVSEEKAVEYIPDSTPLFG